jgi:hypothetical protein
MGGVTAPFYVWYEEADNMAIQALGIDNILFGVGDFAEARVQSQ